MKQLLIILILSVLIYSCNMLDDSDIRKVHVGMPVKEVKSLLNEPYMIKVNQGYNKVESYYSN